jgi:AraC-like DNA-binding protein
MTASVLLPVSLPGLRAVRWTSEALHAGLKDHYAVGRVDRGRSEWWGGGKVWRSGPGCIQVKQPGDVHRDIAREGPTTWTVITLPGIDITRAREAGQVVAPPQLDARDERAAPFHRLFDAVRAEADALAVEVALAEVICALSHMSGTPEQTRPVRRAMQYLRERLAESLTLEDLAGHAGLDKFHLCRAFRAQIGLPPHAYLTHLRVARAKELLQRGTRASEIAPLVGFYDQPQLTRHFRRIVGTTPAKYAERRSAPLRSAANSRLPLLRSP